MEKSKLMLLDAKALKIQTLCSIMEINIHGNNLNTIGQKNQLEDGYLMMTI